MSAEENMALARRFMEARVKGDVDALDEMLSPDFVSHTKLLPEEEPGREGVIWAAAQVADAVSNASVLVEDQVAANDKVVTRFIVHSTHDRGEIMGLAPSGREMTNRVILIHRISGGKIAEELRARGMPLGLMPGMGYEEKQTILEAGEAALLYSDGLVEAHDPKGGMFGFPRLRALVAEHGEERSLGDFLMEDLYSFVGEGWEQEDDITLLTLRCSSALG